MAIDPLAKMLAPRAEPVDASAGRGFLDDSAPTRLTRISDILERLITVQMQAGERFADENARFDMVPLTPDEQAEQMSMMTDGDITKLVKTFGPSNVSAMIKGATKGAMSPPGLPEPTPFDGEGLI
jgi:hypothetical protein